MSTEKAETYGLATLGLTKGLYEVYVKDCLFGEQNGLVGWACTATAVIAWDAYALRAHKETMSHAFHRAWENPNPLYKYMCAGALGVLALHLAHGTNHEAHSTSV